MAATMPVPADLMTVEEAMRAFKIGRSTVFRAIDAGKLTRYSGGLGDKKIYVSRKQLQALVRPAKGKKR